ncbi:MAG: squalene synthase HpnC [Alphaproteobacteria bacterium]|nr:squalene synthase HpnC [Alphaproteobacteria bacterium]
MAPSSPLVEAPSGKERGDENFPVGSLLIRRELRPHVHAFYRFARNADDIADSPLLEADEKLRRLDRMAAVLDGSGGPEAPSASAMRASLELTGITAQHCHDILHAFRQDAVKRRYSDWDDLMEYCRYSASPVGRQLLDLHGESRETWPASDALCSALQVLNHLQDCGDDFRALDRIYLPADLMQAAAMRIEELNDRHGSPGLRQVIDALLDRTDRLIATARHLAPKVRAKGLRWESATIADLAARLSHRLRRGDPLATRVKLSKLDFAAAFLTGVRVRLSA